MQATLSVLSMDNIVVDEKQPRKFFDQKALDELVESVKEQGILQPIMVRPHGTIELPKEKAGQTLYKLVCGERRYRAAESVGLKEVPCIIRDLTDDQALEIQIVENLQRKDVNPMEEAVAFKQLSDRYDHSEIAARVGKGVQYVAQRISLTNLTDGWQQLVFSGEITLAIAYKLARMAPKMQDDAYKASVKKGKVEHEWQLERIVEDDDNDLDKATFKTEDPDLYPEAGPCGKCRYNSKANALLFPDLNKKRICHNSACFMVKTQRAYKLKLEEKVKDPDVVFICADSTPDKEQTAKVKTAKELGVNVLNRDSFDFLEEPDEIQSWEEYLEEQKEFHDFEDMNQEEKDIFLKHEKDNWDEMQEDYERELRKYESNKKTAQKAFVVAGSHWAAKEGQEVLIVPKKGKAAAIAAAKDSGNAELVAIEEEIAGIEQRRARNKELDREKVFAQLQEMLRNKDGAFLSRKGDFEHAEKEALILAMVQDWHAKEVIEAITGKDYNYDHAELYKDIASWENLDHLSAIVARHFIISKLVSMTEQDPERYGKAKALYEIALSYFPGTVEQLEMEQKAKAEKREANVEKRLAGLIAKRDQLKEEATRAANEAAAKKAQKATKKKASA